MTEQCRHSFFALLVGNREGAGQPATIDGERQLAGARYQKSVADRSRPRFVGQALAGEQRAPGVVEALGFDGEDLGYR